MLRAVIVEDVHDNIETLKHLLKSCNYEIEVVAIADTIHSAREVLQMENIDIAFLDIQLKNGIIFDLLDALKEAGEFDFELVFTTAFSSFEMAVKAIQFACLDYLTKPLQKERLNDVLGKISKRPKGNKKEKQLSILLEMIKNNQEAPHSLSVALPKGVIEIIDISDVIYFKADSNTCVIQLTNKLNLHSIKPFSYYLELFSNHSEFIQINRSHLVSKSKVKRYNHRVKELTLQDDQALVVSNRMSNQVKKSFENTTIGFGKLRDLLGF